jgi:hypothetical protein
MHIFAIIIMPLMVENTSTAAALGGILEDVGLMAFQSRYRLAI